MTNCLCQSTSDESASYSLSRCISSVLNTRGKKRVNHLMLRFLLSGPRFEGMLILGERPLARQERLILTDDLLPSIFRPIFGGSD